MRIGVLLGLPSFGGTYQYSLAVIDALRSRPLAEGDSFVVLTDPVAPAAALVQGEAGWEVAPAYPPPSLAQRILARLRRQIGLPGHGPAGRLLERWFLQRWLKRLGLELLLLPVPLLYALDSGLPFVLWVHDLQHRLQPEFPEVSEHGEAEGRERLYRGAARRAILLVADSVTGEEDLLACYADAGLDSQRIRVLPYVPPPAIEEGPDPSVLDRYGLPERYFFYPAQFWPHKNHARLIEALTRLEREQGIEASLVLCGASSSEVRERTHAEMVRLAKDLGVWSRVHDLGYVPDEDLASLYFYAVALVMPTFFGPTNLPVVEAWACGCPVITSDSRGGREQVGDAGLLANPRSVEELTEAMRRLWTDEQLRRDLVERGRARLAEYSREDFARGLVEILAEAKALVRDGAASR